MGRGSLGRVLLLQVSSHLVPLLLQESSHLVPLLLQESSLHFLSFFVKTFLVYFIANTVLHVSLYSYTIMYDRYSALSAITHATSYFTDNSQNTLNSKRSNSLENADTL